MEQEVQQWEPLYDGLLVQIHGVQGSIEDLQGVRIAANGIGGRALWDDEQESYSIRTFDGHQLYLPEENLQEYVRLKPEEGGFDYAWPAAGQEQDFSLRVADTIRKKGYVVIQMLEGDELRKHVLQAAAEREWTLPKPEFEEAYLGRSASSKVSMIRQDDAADTPIEYYDHQVKMVASALYGLVEDYLGFRPDNYRSHTMVRTSLRGEEERQFMQPGPLQQSEVDEGLVESHLDFVQRRRLCIMYLVDNQGGSLHLHPKRELNQPEIVLPLTKDKIVVFRHDLMGYTYKPLGFNDLVVQSWFMEEQQQVKLEGWQGSKEALEDAVGIGASLPIESKKQVHIMTANCRMAGGCYQMDRYWAAFSQQIDGFIYIPAVRWEMEPYYNPDSEQFGAQGKSVTKHSAMLSDEELLNFDNNFFGISKEAATCMAPTQRILLETSFELVHMAGYESFKAMKGQEIGFTIAECGLDFDNWMGFQTTPEGWLEAQNNQGVSTARVAMIFGLTGPAQQVDTACSSSLVSHNLIHAKLRKDKFDRMFSLGHQTCNQVWGFIGLSGAGMLGRTGRCLTYDNSANGMARAEGCGGLFLKNSTDPCVVTERLGVYVSSFVNQDGRSASLTAPNGPSQQLCMRASMKDGNLSPATIVSNENHGTGTALGDPIETGSARSVFRLRGEVPIPMTSSKSNIGHQESTAGANGLLRTLTTLIHGTVPATAHVHQLNQHVEQEGFPGLFPTECVDIGKSQSVAGLNSFGFGGTNSRAELWAHTLHGAHADHSWMQDFDKRRAKRISIEKLRSLDSVMHKYSVAVTCPQCGGPMDWLSSEALPIKPGPGDLAFRPSAIREEGASYDVCSLCYEGGYISGQPRLHEQDQGDEVSVVGSWTNWASPQEMRMEDDGVYTAELALGDTCMEEFQLLLNKDRQRAIFPLAEKANSRSRIVGPAEVEAGKAWLIDGRKDGASTGAVYRIRLEWGEFRRRISWEKLDKSVEAAFANKAHSYSILSSLASFRPADMKQCPGDPLAWEFTGKMNSKEEFFMIQRDKDFKQLIYPKENRPKKASVPVLGPDAGTSVGRDMRLWSVKGMPGDIMMARLQVKDGEIRVTAISEEGGAKTWHNAHGGSDKRYFVKSTWSSTLQELEPDMSDLDVFRLHFQLPSYSYQCRGDFQILVDKDEKKVLYPPHKDAAAGQVIAQGPDNMGEGLCWQVNGPPGQWFEIKLDLVAQDNRKRVTCRPLRRMKGLPST